MTVQRRLTKTIVNASTALIILLVSSCELFEKSPDIKKGQLEVVFQYTQNNTSYASDLISTIDGYYLLTAENYSPFGNSVVKLDQSFTQVWKITFENLGLSKILELPNGKLIGLAGGSLMIVQPDGSSWAWAASIHGQELHALVAEDRLYVYGLDPDYKSFLSAYDFDYNLLWTHKTSWNRRVALNNASQIEAINITGDTLRIYSTSDGSLSKQVLLNMGSKIRVNDFTLDDQGNRYIVGLSNYSECCCNDKISLSKISSTDEVEWQKNLGRSGANNLSNKVLATEGNVYVSGGYGQDMCTGVGADNNPFDGYLVKYKPDGGIEKEYKYNTMGDGLSFVAFKDGVAYVGGGSADADGAKQATIFKVLD